MSITCNIEFENNPTCTFYGGQMVTTKISLYLKKATEIKGIAFKIHGFEHMSWSDDDDSYSGDEDYINIKNFLLGTPESECTTLEAGEHNFVNQYQLPLICPSSVESQYGQIRYSVKVIVIRPWKFDKTFTKAFTIVKLVDLNLEPMVANPITRESDKKFHMRVYLPQSGYVPGQTIPVNVSITNENDKMIEKLKISLIMIVSSYSKTPSKKAFDSVLKISKLKDNNFVNNKKHNSIYELHVPSTPPSDNTFGTLIHISYQVEVEAVLPKFQTNQVVILPISIGTVPLMDNFNKGLDEAGLLSHKDNNSSITSSMPSTLSLPWENTTSNIPPPNYEEASFMTPVNVEENKHGEKDYVPRYPVFNIPS